MRETELQVKREKADMDRDMKTEQHTEVGPRSAHDSSRYGAKATRPTASTIAAADAASKPGNGGRSSAVAAANANDGRYDEGGCRCHCGLYKGW